MSQPGHTASGHLVQARPAEQVPAHGHHRVPRHVQADVALQQGDNQSETVLQSFAVQCNGHLESSVSLRVLLLLVLARPRAVVVAAVVVLRFWTRISCRHDMVLISENREECHMSSVNKLKSFTLCPSILSVIISVTSSRMNRYKIFIGEAFNAMSL